MTEAKLSCPLCKGDLVSEHDVHVNAGDSVGHKFERAWVCTECSAAFPIAVLPTFGFLHSQTKTVPLSSKGKRAGS